MEFGTWKWGSVPKMYKWVTGGGGALSRKGTHPGSRKLVTLTQNAVKLSPVVPQKTDEML